MKQITKNTILKQGDKIYQPLEVDEVIYWTNENIYGSPIMAQSQPKIEGIPVIILRYNELDSLVWFGLKFVCEEECHCHAECDWASKQISDMRYYTQKDIEKVRNLVRNSSVDYTLEEIFKKINSISVIEVDEQFNVISYD